MTPSSPPDAAAPPPALSRTGALWLAALLWAAIYLPCLGSLEIKGEEGRRLLPALAMLDTGRWVVPQIGGVDYLSKPPLVNWLAAASFRTCELLGGDARSEWAARAPSVLVVLALALALTGALARWLTPAGALLAAVFALTNIGLMEKGRLAEIEALYISLYGIALALWLAGWRRDALAAEAGAPPRPGWRTWTLPWVFLGLGLLTKGPLHLLFFYGVVVAVVGLAGRWRDLLNPAHFVGIILMLTIFAAWAVPYFHATAADRAGGVWLAQFQGRLEVNEGFRFGAWLLNIPRGLVNFLPWTVLLPLLWRALPEAVPAVDRALLRGLRWAALGGFLTVSLAPGGQPRYTLPLLVPAAVALALACRRGWGSVEADGALPPWLGDAWTRTVCVAALVAGALALPAAALAGRGGAGWLVAAGIAAGTGWLAWRVVPWKLPPPWERVQPHRTLPLAVASTAVMGLLTWDYALGVVPRLRRYESIRPAARAINRAVAADPDPAARAARVTVLAPGFLPLLYYMKPGPDYAQAPTDVPVTAPWLLARPSDLRPSPAERWRDVLTVTDKRVRQPGRNRWHLYRLE